MPWADLVLAAIQLATDLAARAKQSGELTPEQEALLDSRAQEMFAAFSTPPPSPEGTGV